MPADLTVRPVALYMCGTCDHWHRAGYGGDCRDDSERFTDEQRDSRFGAEGVGWVESVTADLTAHPLPFGGLALVPVSDAGREWLGFWADEMALDDAPIFCTPGACMAGFPSDAIGFEPQDWPGIVTAARDAGLIVEQG